LADDFGLASDNAYLEEEKDKYLKALTLVVSGTDLSAAKERLLGVVATKKTRSSAPEAPGGGHSSTVDARSEDASSEDA
jgi:hypothetical protein